jgi:hypothetical protein
MVAATMKQRSLIAAVAAFLIFVFIGSLAVVGNPRGSDKLGRFDGQGIAKIDPAEIVQIEWRRNVDHLILQRSPGRSWSFNQIHVSREIEDHIGVALNFISVSEPSRALTADEMTGVRLADFGIEPATYTVALRGGAGSDARFDFGRLNPVGVSQYVRIDGRPELYLLPRYVGSEWAVAADQTLRLANAGAVQGEAGRPPGRWLLSNSISQIWSIDIATDGKVHRLERDAAGDWLLRRSGQKAHAWSATAIAEPEQARRIQATLAALERTWARDMSTGYVSSGEFAAGGSAQIPIRVLLYARDNTVPVAKFEIGRSTVDRPGRFVHIDGQDGLFSISLADANSLSDLMMSFE